MIAFRHDAVEPGTPIPSRAALPSWDHLVRVVSRAYGVTPESVHNSRARWRAVSSARRVLAHIARDRYGLGCRQIAERMGVSQSAVRQLASRPLCS